MKLQEERSGHFGNVHNHSRISKSLVLIVSLQVALLAVLYHTTYPLEYPHTGLFRASGYWLLLLSMIVSAAALAYYFDSAASSFVSTLVVYVALNSYQLLYYSVVGGDTSSQIMQLSLMSRFSHVSASMSPYFDYLSWPGSYMFALVVKKTYGIESAVTTVDIGYAIYFLLFVIAVWLFSYRSGDGFLAFLTSIAFMVLAFTALNNQFVPQFLALVLLFFLFSTMDKEGLGWRAVELTLFVSLVFTHLVFPVFYLLARTLRPGITSLLDSYRSDVGFERMYEILLRPVVLVRRTISSDTWVSNGAFAYAWVFGLWVVYFVKNTPRELHATVSGPMGRTEGNPVLGIISDLGSTGAASGTEVELLYGLVPRSFDLAVTWGSRFVVVALFGVLVLSFLYNDIDDALSGTDRSVDYRIEILVGCVLLFTFAWALNTIYGIRVLQVAFLPVALFFYGLRKHRRAVVVLIVCLSLLSPVLLANSYANNTLAAGGNTIGHQETQAGATIGAHYDQPETVVVPPNTPYPVGPPDDMRNNDIRFVVEDGTVPASDLLIYSDRFEDYLDYRGIDCTVDGQRKNIVYDNGEDGAQVIWSRGDGAVADCLEAEFG